ncbi:hypothetical protein Pint_32964 [Pistacia integerrima]|nr:hypothetical protein Pint_32964 [Pistacia integerrima]KAJ0078225.1 hypothetical protein Patl1_36891 [Pistacia atlantica]
MYARLSS